MITVMALFLARVSASILTIIAITMLGLSFPFEPAQVATSLFTVGVPALLLSLWAKPVTQVGDILPELVRFVIPSAILTMIVGAGALHARVPPRADHGDRRSTFPRGSSRCSSR